MSAKMLKKNTQLNYGMNEENPKLHHLYLIHLDRFLRAPSWGEKKGEEERLQWIGRCGNHGVVLGMSPSKNMGHESHMVFLLILLIKMTILTKC